jgi:hypothetical protein
VISLNYWGIDYYGTAAWRQGFGEKMFSEDLNT